MVQVVIWPAVVRGEEQVGKVESRLTGGVGGVRGDVCGRPGRDRRLRAGRQ